MKVCQLLETLKFGTMISFQFENEARRTIPEAWIGDNFDDVYDEDIKVWSIEDNMIILILKA